ncbi:MAG: GtrA family protein [Aquabacterium sp.]|jgi:putative flippase GtrA|uniref:GtrA family protein n=1 Tax=Aquabacterium sp. TaxID=1872578 RepID=UPI002A35DAC6|nr:GtrA family protein [Aquabacterium sp.]MDX9845240.1 GtrA family protein [Aquabacterium sp.]
MICREAATFLVVGGVTVLVDFTSYTLMQAWIGLPVDVAKGLGFLIGTAFAYFANRHWTFGHQEPVRGSAWRFALLYGVTLAFNVLINAASLRALHGVAWDRSGAFILATGVSAFLNFLGMKYLIFRQRPGAKLSST